jgi:hypothetical protein
MNKPEKINASFRDPSGFVFKENNKIFRQINNSYRRNYDHLVSSGLLKKLFDENLLIYHKEIKDNTTDSSTYKIIEPLKIPFITFPYEWSFSALYDAALLTLKIQEIALEYGMSLKDASAYNIQFFQGKPILIDTLSFEIYEEEKPWIAYKQFCQHFLAPLALMSYKDLRFGTLSQIYLDGIPLDLVSNLLPFKTKLNLGLAAHIHLHAKSQKDAANSPKARTSYHLNQNQFKGILASLESTVRSLKIPKQETVWQDYYHNTNYTDRAFKYKKDIVTKWIKLVKPKSVWDSGANDGTFGQISSGQKINTIATDFDPQAIDKCYLDSQKQNNNFILPLIIDLVNPSPSIGWQNKERPSFLDRSQFDLTLCLALIHHLAISNNLPLGLIAEFYQTKTKFLIIEFVPKKDSNAQRLLKNREDIFDYYDQANFEKEFSKFFKIKYQLPVKNSLRYIYLMERK